MAIPTFPDKDPEEVLDYSQHFAALLAAGLSFDSVSVEVESSDPPETPFLLEVTNAQLAEDQVPGTADTVLFWLKAGTPGTKYTLKTEFSDSLNAPEDRTFVRRSKIKIKAQ